MTVVNSVDNDQVTGLPEELGYAKHNDQLHPDKITANFTYLLMKNKIKLKCNNTELTGEESIDRKSSFWRTKGFPIY